MFFVFQTRVCGGDPEADADVALATCMELSGGEWLEAEPLYAPRREAASSLVGDGGEVWLVTGGNAFGDETLVMDSDKKRVPP